MLIGVVGKSGAGKSTLIRKMHSFDNSVIHVDIDKVGHDILSDEKIVRKIVEIVGDPTVVENGVINRKKVGNIIFNDKKKYDEYYKYTEDIEYAIIDKIIEDNKDKKVVLDWILLDNTKYWGKLDYKILVKTNYEVRKSRVVIRDNINEKYFDLRENMKDDYNTSEMDYIIDGNTTNDEMIKKILGELKWVKMVCLKVYIIKQTW